MVSNLLYLVLIFLFISQYINIVGIAVVLGIGLSLLLKHLIGIPRPNGMGYGMPSTHAQTYMILIILMAFDWYYHHSTMSMVLTIVLIILWILTGFDKIANKEHSFNQYAIGSIIGFIISVQLGAYTTKSV